MGKLKSVNPEDIKKDKENIKFLLKLLIPVTIFSVTFALYLPKTLFKIKEATKNSPKHKTKKIMKEKLEKLKKGLNR